MHGPKLQKSLHVVSHLFDLPDTFIERVVPLIVANN